MSEERKTDLWAWIVVVQIGLRVLKLRRALCRMLLLPAVAWCALFPSSPANVRVEAGEDAAAGDVPRQMALQIGNFDRRVYGGSGPEAVAAARNRMDSILQRRLEAVDQVCRLTAVQRQRLQLAGRGDIARYFEHVGQRRESFAAIEERTAAAVNALSREALRLQGIGSAGPFYGGSLFGKTARRLLTDEQYAAFEALREIEQAGGSVVAIERGGEKLLRIRLTGTSFSDAEMVYLADLTNVQQLALNGTKVTDAGLTYLKDLRRLDELDLCETPVTDGGLVHLAGLTSLKVLYLANTQISDRGLEHLTQLKKLKAIYLAGTPVDDAGIAQLKAALPDIEVRK